MTINVGEVGMVPIESIEIGERARRKMGNLEDLEESMKKSGLVQPLAVRKLENEKYLLLAGERRLTVLLSNNTSTVPVRIYKEELSELEMKVIEKAENFYRKDMEYYEYDSLVREIHELKQAIHGVSSPGPGAGGHKLKDTAKMFGVTDASISTAIKRADAREAFPELFEKCKTQKDATNVIKKIDEAIVKDTIAKKLERENANSNSKLSKLSNCYIIGDFFEGVKKIPDNVMHLVEIDPPYAINLAHQKKSVGESIYRVDEYNEINTDNYPKFMLDIFKECYRVMSDHSWLLCWYAPEPWQEIIYNLLIDTGFKTTRMNAVWTKKFPMQCNNPQIRLSNSYECFYYAWKGKPVLNKPGRSNDFNFPPIPPNQKTHPTERPIELMKEIYNTFAFPGSRIMIPFLGSGSGLIAAHELGMSPIGFEISKSYKDAFLVKVNSL